MLGMPCSLKRLFVRGVAAHGEQTAMDLGMQRLHPPVHHLGHAGDIGDVDDLEARLAQQFGGTAGGDELDALGAQASGKLHHARLVADRKQRAGDLLHGRLSRMRSGRAARLSRFAVLGKAASAWTLDVRPHRHRRWAAAASRQPPRPARWSTPSAPRAPAPSRRQARPGSSPAVRVHRPGTRCPRARWSACWSAASTPRCWAARGGRSARPPPCRPSRSDADGSERRSRRRSLAPRP